MPRYKIIIPCLLFMMGLFSVHSGAAAKAPSVSVSIKPIHSLVSEIMNGVSVPSLIVKGSRSPHTYSMKPSDARGLSRSDVIIWVGPGLEMFLQKPLMALSEKSRIVTLVPEPAQDPHQWLSPVLAVSIVDRVLMALIEADPDHGKTYKSNAARLKVRLDALHAEGNRQLRPLGQKPFLVFHDAWGHFATAFGLSISGTVALNPERPPGANGISAIRRLIKEREVRCLFREPQFASPLLATVMEGQDQMKELELDPLGSALAPGADLYFQMMENNIAAVTACLR
ncbi:MAG: zinc ABC transporter substrate-binding protein [Rhodospirillales bacterium]|nr:zinc ABC transporter substrate-binding protein [Rhodospirillales bacterium]